jgi:RNA polymerase sigma factor (sigma-70 family)
VAEGDDFRVLMDRVWAGDAAAYEQLLARHGEAVREAVRGRLHPRLRPRYDSLDFVQDVWASFVAMRPAGGQFADPDELTKYLCQIARFKVIEAFRHRFSTKRQDITRERPLPPAAEESQAGLVGREPSPSQTAVADERWESLTRRLPEGHRAVLGLLRDGYTHEEIARMLGIGVRTVERIVRRLKELTA